MQNFSSNLEVFQARQTGMVKYQRHEFHHEPEEREAPLSTFVYDIPYFGACGVFPPWHIINQYFSSGGAQGGMSPGATWAAFEVSEIEYAELVAAIEDLEPQSLGASARYCKVKFQFDHTFDHFQDRFEWLRAVCERHRSEFHKRRDAANHEGA